ncbi:MAG: transposase family protein, partial [Bacteroidales bacterium]
MENSQEIFALALGLEMPWEVERITFDKENLQLDIYIRFVRGHKFKGSDGQLYTAHDTVERTWQHLNFFQHHCYLHCKVPRIKD